MDLDTTAHLLTLAMGRRLEIARNLSAMRQMLPAGAPGIGSLEAERFRNEQAIAQLEFDLRHQVAA